jgi:hypothetical protein
MQALRVPQWPRRALKPLPHRSETLRCGQWFFGVAGQSRPRASELDLFADAIRHCGWLPVRFLPFVGDSPNKPPCCGLERGHRAYYEGLSCEPVAKIIRKLFWSHLSAPLVKQGPEPIASLPHNTPLMIVNGTTSSCHPHGQIARRSATHDAGGTSLLALLSGVAAPMEPIIDFEQPPEGIHPKSATPAKEVLPRRFGVGTHPRGDFLIVSPS